MSVQMQLENAAASLLSKLHNNNQNGEQKDFSGLQVLLYSQHAPQRGSLRDLTVSCVLREASCVSSIATAASEHLLVLQSEQVSQLVVVPGIVTAASNPKVIQPLFL